MGSEEFELEGLGRTDNIYGITSTLVDLGIGESPLDLRKCIGKPSDFSRVEKQVHKILELTESDMDMIRSGPYGGIKNTGATCYLNTFVQALFFNRDLRCLLLATDYGSESPLAVLQNIIGELHMGNMKAVDPVQFVNSLAICRETQEDSHEFSTLFINWLHKNIQHTSVRSLFEGSLINTFICPSCGAVISHEESFLDLRLDVADNVNVNDLLQAISGRCDIIEGYSCLSEKCCGRIVDITKQTTFKTLPNYLTVVMNRYTFDRADGTREKISKPVKIKLNDVEIIPGKIYACYGIVEHVSSSVSSGHYIGHFRDLHGDNTWYTFDDADVRRAKKFASEIYTSSSAYVMHYVNVDTKHLEVVMNPRLHLKMTHDNSQRLSLVDSKKSLKLEIEHQFTLRKSLIESLKATTLTTEQIKDWVVVDYESLRDWGQGGDIARSFSGAAELNDHKLSYCEHGKVDPLSVLKGEVKYVPKNIFGDLKTMAVADAICEACASEFRDQLNRASEVGLLIEELFESSDTTCYDELVWVNEKILRGKLTAQFRKSLTTPTNILKKWIAWKHNTTWSMDLSEGVKCVHENLRIDAISVLTQKPKKILEKLVLVSLLSPSFVPRLVMSDMGTNHQLCVECCDQKIQRESFSKFLNSVINRTHVDDPYTAIPSAWIRRILRGASGSNHEFKSVLCEHGKLSQSGPKMTLVSTDEFDVIRSEDFRNCMLGKSVEEIPVVGIDTCAECVGETGKHVNVRVFEGCVSSGEVHDHERGVTLLHRPGNSRLYGSTGELDLDSMVGRVLKTNLLDLGIMGDDEVPEGAENDINLYVNHPLLRGSVIRLENDYCARGVIGKALEGNVKALEILRNGVPLDTLFVEFTFDRTSSVEPKKKTRRVQKSDSDAGLKGSILREPRETLHDGVIDLS